MTRVEPRSVVGAMAGCLFSVSAFGGVDVLTYHNDNARTGRNLQEHILTPTTVNPNSFGKLFSYAVDGYVYAQPLYVSGLDVPGVGKRNVVFVATEHNSVYAFDADSNDGPNGGLLWHVNLSSSAPTPSGDLDFHAIVPEVGITGTPVIDLRSKTLYVNAFTQEGNTFFHRVHALSLLNGSEKPFSPAEVQASVPGVGVGSSSDGVVEFQARQQLQRSALTLANGNLYVAFAGFTDMSDTDPYHGWIIGFKASTLKLLPQYVFNTTPNGTVAQFGQIAGRGAIWMAGDGPAVDASNNLYFATGDGNFNAFADSGGTEYGDSIVKLSTRGRLSVADYFTPLDQGYYRVNDLDVGSGGVLLLPDQPGRFPHLLIAGGKPGYAYLIDRDRMTSDGDHYDSTGTQDKIVQTMPLTGSSFSTPAYFNGTIYYAANRSFLRGYALSNGTLIADMPNLIGPRQFGFPGATPSVSGNGNRHGIVWTVQYANPAVLAAYDATDLRQEIYNSAQAGSRDQLPSGVKFVLPTVANGKVYVGAQYALTVFGLLTPFSASGTALAGRYEGLFSQASGIDTASAGAVGLTITKKGNYSGRLLMATNRYSFHGRFESLESSTTARGKRGPTLTVNLRIDTNDNNQIVGAITDGSWIANLLANRTAAGGHADPSSFAGRYTVILPGRPGSAQIPQGDGYGRARVNENGRAIFKGALADGTKLVQIASVSEDGQWPFYARLRRGTEQVFGWLNLAAGTDPAGTINWIKVPDANARFYPDGFNVDIDSAISVYQPPAVNFNDGTIAFSGGDLASDFSNDVNITSGKATNQSTNRLTLKIVPATGLFNGVATDPNGGGSIRFSGAVLQNQNSGSGFFLRSGQSGRVSLSPR